MVFIIMLLLSLGFMLLYMAYTGKKLSERTG